jgi:hypothetical protein
VTKLPRVDTSNINRIVVEPFNASGNTSEERQIADDVSRTIGNLVAGTRRFTIVEATRNRGGNYADVADAVFSGEINRYTVQDSTYETAVFDPVAKVDVPQTMYRRDVTLEFTYRLVRARDGGTMDRLTLSGTEVSAEAELTYLTPARDLARKIIDKNLRNLPRDIAPWTTTEERTLEQYKVTGKAKDPRMKEALAQVKAGSYKSASNLYSGVYADSGNFAAGYNAAITTELFGNLQEAIDLMRSLEAATGNAKAQAEYQRMTATLAESQTLQTKYDASNVGGPVLAAIKEGAANLSARLKPQSRLSILNASQINPRLVDYIVEELTTQLFNSNVSFTVVERKNLEAVLAEHNFQMSGEVSDDSAVSIGRFLGAEIIITCSIIEQQRMQRLLITALSVETAEILYQTSLSL